MKKAATIYDISEMLNISASTVSRALNNNPKISSSTRELVLTAAKQLNYHHNNMAGRLRSGKSNTIGIIVPYINHGLFSAVIEAIEEMLSPKGYNVIICQSHDDEKLEVKHINNLIASKVECIFVSISLTTKATKHFQKVTDANIPLVFFDRRVPIKNISSVTLNDQQGAYLATQHLIHQGCKRIALFTGSKDLEIYQYRYKGYVEALTEYNIPVLPELIVNCKSSIDSGSRAFETLVKQTNGNFDGIFSTSDYAAIGALQKLKARNYKVPEEVAVVGFSNEKVDELLEIPLSSVHQLPKKMGEQAAKIFLSGFDTTLSTNLTYNHQITPELIIRQSSLRRIGNNKTYENNV